MIKKNHILSGSNNLFLFFVSLVFFLTINSISLILFISQSWPNQSWIAEVLIVAFSSGIMGLISWYTNRAVTKVTFDEDSKMISRKGFFMGFHYQIPQTNILKVEKINLSKDGTYLVLIDSVHNTSKRLTKNSPIYISFNEAGIAFIKAFYEGDIPLK